MSTLDSKLGSVRGYPPDTRGDRLRCVQSLLLDKGRPDEPLRPRPSFARTPPLPNWPCTAGVPKQGVGVPEQYV